MSFRYNAYDHVPCYDDIHRSPAEISYEIVDMTISSLITDDQHTDCADLSEYSIT